jgi:hypothetical protein
VKGSLCVVGNGPGLGLGIPGTSFDCAMGGAFGRSCLIDSASLGRSSLES